MSFFLVVKAEVVRTLIVMRRYWFRTLTGMVISYGMLMMLIVAFVQRPDEVQAEMQARFADPVAATNWALGFIIGMYAFGVVGMFSQGLQGMAQNGQLEQLCMSPHGLVTNFLARSFVSAVTSILTSSILITLIAHSVGGMLHADFVPTIVLLALTFVNLLGFGFMVGGLVLVFKQVGQVAVLVRLGLFGLAMYATEANVRAMPEPLQWFLHALPVTDAAVCLKYVLVQGQEINGEFASVFLRPSFFFLALNCVAWTFVGISCFKAMESHSRGKGTLGAY